jgi:hypothetical protein
VIPVLIENLSDIHGGLIHFVDFTEENTASRNFCYEFKKSVAVFNFIM